MVSIILAIGIGITLFLAFFNKGSDESVDIKPVDAEAYFKENREIVSIIDVNESTDVTTEKESIGLFTDRVLPNIQLPQTIQWMVSIQMKKRLRNHHPKSTQCSQHTMFAKVVTCGR